MSEGHPPTANYLDVTRAADGRYCVTLSRGERQRRSYTPSPEHVIAQARRLGNFTVRTDDLALRQRCQEAGVAVVERGADA